MKTRIKKIGDKFIRIIWKEHGNALRLELKARNLPNYVVSMPIAEAAYLRYLLDQALGDLTIDDVPF